MRILQGYVSKSIMDFPFHQIYLLDDYNNDKRPAVFFGMYRHEDFYLFNNHKSAKVVFWTGQDALNFDRWGEVDYVEHFTAHPRVYELLKSKGLSVTLVQPSSFLNEINPKKLGTKIYAYCPKSMPIYHGIEIIQELQERGYEILIGDGSHTQEQWRNEMADLFYQECYIGLCLSEFAGGGTSIIEMGLRGMFVVTNVFRLSNCLRWSQIEDVISHIECGKVQIGQTNHQLARKVYADLDKDFKWLEI